MIGGYITWDDLGVSVAKQTQFINAGIRDPYDLVEYIPRAYKDFTQVTGLHPSFETVTAIVEVEDVRMKDGYTGASYIRAVCREKESGATLHVYWFHQNYLYGKIKELLGKTVFVAGKLAPASSETFFLINMPTIFEEHNENTQRVIPVYKKIKGMSIDYLTQKIQRAFELDATDKDIEKYVPQKYIDRYNLLTRSKSLQLLHFPHSVDDVKKGQIRFIFDDLLYYAVGNELMLRESSITSDIAIEDGKAYKKTSGNLPFKLTPDQKRALKGMLEITCSGKRLNALLQGDVGSGKTIVAFLMMMAAADSGHQSVIMAPTQILAKQHYKELLELGNKVGYKTVFLGAGMKKKERLDALKAIATGEAMFVVGTHAVLNDDIMFSDLGLMIVDEEHKFGVKQRTSVIKRAKNGVHSITMSATPIPRSFAEALYGNNVALFTILTKPKGRKTIKTSVVDSVNDMCEMVQKEVEKGHQAYIVCPLIDESDKEIMKNVHSVEEISRECGDFFEKNGITFGVLTGKDKKEYAEKTIAAFKDGGLDVLIATSVIEVGVNVPNATVMAVASAERFGLSSLHQLRGRVGRSDLQSYCILQSEKGLGNKRLVAMENENDGFKIAEADLQIRGAGDFLGTDQSGNYDNYIHLAMRYPHSYRNVQSIAKEILDSGEKYGLLSILQRRVRAASASTF